MFRLVLFLLIALSSNVTITVAQDVFSEHRDIQALIDEREPTQTGSGFAFGGSLTSYNTIRYHKEAFKPSQQEHNNHK